MAIKDIFSRRKKQQVEFTDLPHITKPTQRLRTQVVHGLMEAFDHNRLLEWEMVEVCKSLKKEYGVFELPMQSEIPPNSAPTGEILTFINETSNVDYFLDAIELCLQAIEKFSDVQTITSNGPASVSDQFLQGIVADINSRFREAGFGYQFEAGMIVQADSLVMHDEVIVPSLLALEDPMYSGANEEYRSAHAHFRAGRFKECVTDCCKAFESMLKTICSVRGWNYEETDNAKKLINTCLSNGLAPTFHETQTNALQQLLESGIPTNRNKRSGHGQGSVRVALTEHFTAYQLHLTATTLLFLVRCEIDTRVK